MSFRKYGGTQFARSHNIVKSNVNTTDSFYVTKNVGQPNTYINFESDISGNVNIYGVLDVSGNLIVSGDADINGKLHVQEDIDCSGNVNIDGNIDCIGDITANEFFITGPIDSAPNSVVPKSYVDSVAVGLTPLAPCVLCSNVEPIILSGYGQIIDGFTISSVYDGSFVLINAQGGVGVAAITNGVYVVSSGTWLRPTELENGDKATGTAMLIKQGVVNAGKTFVCTSGSDTIPAYIGTSPVLWVEFLSQYSLGRGLNKVDTTIQVDSSLNFIEYLDNYEGPNPGTMNIGTYTPTINIGLNTTPTSLINTINLATVGENGQQSALNWGTTSNSGILTFRGGTFYLYSSGVYNQTSGNVYDTNIDGTNSSKTTGNINIGTGNSLTGQINLGTGTGVKPITIGSATAAVAVNGTTTITGATTILGATNITGGITASGLITANAGIGTTTLTASGLITANTLTASGLITANTLTASGLITANAGIGTTTLTASGLITANTLTASGLITANNGLTVTGTTNINNSIYLYNGVNNSVISQNGSTLNLINNNADGNVVISNSTHPNNNISFDFDTSGNKITFKDGNGSSDTGFIRWYAVTVDTNSYLQIGTTDNATTNQEKIYFTQYEFTDSSTYARMRIDTAGVWINPSGDANFSSATTYSLNVNGTVNFSGVLTATGGTTITGTTNINTTGTSSTNIGNAGVTVAVTGTTNINNTGTSSTNIGNVTGTTTITGTTNINTTGSSSTSIGNTGTTTITGTTVAVNGATNINGYVNITSGGLEVTGGLTNNNEIVCTGVLTANGGIELNNGSINLYDDLDYSTIFQYGSALTIQNSSSGGYIYINTYAGTNGIIVYDNGCVGIGGGGGYPATALQVNGTVTATSYNSTSDYRIKKDVVTLDETFTVDKLRPVTYNNTKMEKQDIGLIAHELEEIYPFLVNGEKDGENFQTVNYTGLIGILIKEIQELKERVKKLENPPS